MMGRSLIAAMELLRSITGGEASICDKKHETANRSHTPAMFLSF